MVLHTNNSVANLFKTIYKSKGSVSKPQDIKSANYAQNQKIVSTEDRGAKRGQIDKSKNVKSKSKLQNQELNSKDSLIYKNILDKPKAEEFCPLKDVLGHANIQELGSARLLASLCGLTYCLDEVTDALLFRKYRVNLVTSSRDQAQLDYEEEDSPRKYMQQGDGLAPEINFFKDNGQEFGLDTLQTSQGEETFSDKSDTTDTITENKFKEEQIQGNEKAVEEELWLNGAQSAMLAGMPMWTANTLRMAKDLRTLSSQSLAQVVQTVTGTKKPDNEPKKQQRREKKVTALGDINQEWYVCDEKSTRTRLFVIQGSTCFESWKINLSFDPTQFEDPKLGVQIHRGVYQVAETLYRQFLPLVLEHLSEHDDAKIGFSGHSLGGSLAQALLMMYVLRGVLPPSAVFPVYTFGAAGIFCQSNCKSCQGVCRIKDPETAPLPSILSLAGLPENVFRNVMMDRDIVPKAFSCDYSNVAEFVKTWSKEFRVHYCLSAGLRQVMYNHVGEVLVLQADSGMSFVRGDGFHPSLPQRPGLWRLRPPPPAPLYNFDVDQMRNKLDQTIKKVAHNDGIPHEEQLCDVYTSLPPSCPQPASSDLIQVPIRDPQVALNRLMDEPHPLQILRDPGAYGDKGSIARYHDPVSYTKGIASVIRYYRSQGNNQLIGHGLDSKWLALRQEEEGVVASDVEGGVQSNTVPVRSRRAFE